MDKDSSKTLQDLSGHGFDDSTFLTSGYLHTNTNHLAVPASTFQFIPPGISPTTSDIAASTLQFTASGFVPSGFRSASTNTSASTLQFVPSGIKPASTNTSASTLQFATSGFVPSGIRPASTNTSASTLQFVPSGIGPDSTNISASTLQFVPSGIGPESTNTSASTLQFATSGGSTNKRKRRAWTAVETSVLWEKYEDFYINGSLSSKTSKGNGPGWEELTLQVNKALAERNIAPRSLHQIKEKINNLKSEYKRIVDKESQTGEETQSKPEWFDKVDRVFGSRDEITPPHLIDSSKKDLPQEDDTSLSSLSPACSITDDAEDQESAAPSKKKKTGENKKKKKDVELLNILEKQVQLMESAQEKEDRMMKALIEMEQKSEERQKAILMALIDKL